ncbi:N-acetylmuramoyl-L-alanine amidase LytC precursor [Clostridium magnum DSM 2767]|uniref:N-acetylmuramoyl-L-alanine amidase LytC n=2 Tax=Clostridium magnum TaxID=33954 RepID=A0A162RIQ3_9CLOT|nr:cell wall-binding repeat-containing protein [Clostridium magnum]KZL89964.1 N-acetylmuramoyl-L-alanine amidase LytC precursor [Clostridium magnum DSM 2767]SHJ32801.1 Putative cell wall-binding protein [Clostridium magnum DSM 2767]
MIIINYKMVLKNNFKILLLFLFIISTTSKVYAQGKYQRYGGNDRYETSIKIAQNFSDKSEYAILVSGQNYPDALCACPLSKKYNAPIILTSEGQLDERAATQIKNLQVSKVFIIGKSISKDVEESLSSMGITSERIGGENRYETAMLVADHVGIKDRIVVVSGENYPDALSIAPVAAIMDMPIILVNKDVIPDVVKNSLKDKGYTYTYVIGSEGAISEEVKAQFKNSERIFGQNRYDTNIAVINRFIDVLDLSHVYLASAVNFPDSLSGSALAQKNKSPLILISEDINETEQNNIKQILASSKNTYVLGSEGAVSLKALYLVGLEEKPPEEPKPQGVQPPPWTDSFGVINADETTRVNIRQYANSSSAVIGSAYGSLSEVKVLEGEGDYYYVETLDYDSGNVIRGYVPKVSVKTVTPTGPYNIYVNKSKQRVYIFNGQTIVKEFICSTGKDETPTPSGRFLTGGKGPFFYASDSSICYYWTRINNNYLFHSAIYDLQGYPIESEYEKLGSKASHGCIRLPIDDAKWIQDYIPYGTLVTVSD